LNVKGKTVVITGANSGIGFATATGLARLGATVIMACRDKGRGEEARNDIISTTGNPLVELLLVDLASQQSIREAVASFKARRDRLDVLINNAAVFKFTRAASPDGPELMFATNHLGPFLLANLLLDVLRASAPARVLTVTAPSTVPLDFDDLQGEKKFSAAQAFGASKMCNLLFTYELARRMEGTGVTANAIHPGLAKSNLMKEANPIMRWAVNLMSGAPEKAAETPIYLASAPEVATVSGQFFRDKKPINSNAYSHDRAMQNRLWEISATLANPA
jgi:NAD(P)-dependent dehydrogenase (short-subunit alcohol dehydrogenase family)